MTKYWSRDGINHTDGVGHLAQEDNASSLPEASSDPNDKVFRCSQSIWELEPQEGGKAYRERCDLEHATPLEGLTGAGVLAIEELGEASGSEDDD